MTVEVFERLGGRKDALFDRLSFNEDRLFAAEGHLSFDDMHQLILAVLKLTDAPWIGLAVGKAQTISSWGILGYAIISCATE
ncbi:MAG: AraC family transcriptional regulator ligand-binding domain-containing protein [Pseudomonadota bacterium]